MDTMLSFSNNDLATSFLSKEQIATICPMALCTTPTNPRVSERYVFANTETVIDDLAKEGWLPVEAKQVRSRKVTAFGVRSFHMIAFQNPGVYISKKADDGSEVVDCYPRIILTNSHDGFNSFRFMVGLFRLVCSNGLIIATDQMADIHVRHVNYSFEELRSVIATAMTQVHEQVTAMNAMTEVVLDEQQKSELARKAICIRKNAAEPDKVHVSEDTISKILTPMRKEDEGDTLWQVFNVLQEHLMRGDYYARSSATARPRKARALTSVAKTIDFNKGLFRAAYEYAAVAA